MSFHFVVKRHRYKPSLPVQPTKFQGGIEELKGNCFDCTGYDGQADLVGRDYKSGGTTRTEYMTQASLPITVAVRPVDTIVLGEDGTTVVSRTPPGALDISDYQSEKKLYDFQILNQNENQNKVHSLVWPQ